MKTYFLRGIAFLTVLNTSNVRCEDNGDKKPKLKNVIIIVADDHGFNDVSYRGKSFEIPTYNIDALAYNGVILDKYLSIFFLLSKQK